MQRFALLGAGFIGSVHAANLAAHPDVDFRLVFDVDQDRAKTLAVKHGARAAADLAEVFDSAAVDAVFIASSTDTHAAHLRRAAGAGLAVLCEKPIDLDLGQARETAAFAARHAVTVMVDFNRRFDRDYAELKRIVGAGEIGKVELIQLTSRGPAMPPLSYIATSGGQMRDQTVHFFDLVRWLTGADPVEVFATGSALAEPRLAEYGDVDTSVVSLRLPGGAWSRSTAPAARGTAMTSGSRSWVQQAWPRPAVTAPARCPGTTQAKWWTTECTPAGLSGSSRPTPPPWATLLPHWRTEQEPTAVRPSRHHSRMA